MRTILSYGMGVESSALLVRWLREPSTRPCSLDDLVVVSAQTGDEYEDTQELVETHILPLLREYNVRYVQVARRGPLEADGIVVLDDTRQPAHLFIEGAYKLSDELRTNGTVPQFGGVHRCSLKAKVFPIERWMREYYPHPARHAFGYNAEETKRIEKSLAAEAKRVAFGFNAEESKRIERTREYDGPLRISIFPLLEWRWNRDRCLDYLREQFDVTWKKSACVYCPFNRLTADAIDRHKAHPAQVADALMLEHLSLSMNPRGTLYPSKSLVQITLASGNHRATSGFQRKLDESDWAIYRIRRLYHAAKDKSGALHPEKKGTALRAVEKLTDTVTRAEANLRLRELAVSTDEIVEQRGISYVYRLRCGMQYPTREEFFVAAPALVAAKARYSMQWFDQQWESPQLSLFE
jgi:5-methylcytosine-specific restriction endonuclease McrA